MTSPTHRNGARETLVKLARNAYAAHWERVRVSVKEFDAKAIEKHEADAWLKAVDAVVRGMS